MHDIIKNGILIMAKKVDNLIGLYDINVKALILAGISQYYPAQCELHYVQPTLQLQSILMPGKKFLETLLSRFLELSHKFYFLVSKP